jgi:hypothetical protein
MLHIYLFSEVFQKSEKKSRLIPYNFLFEFGDYFNFLKNFQKWWENTGKVLKNTVKGLGFIFERFFKSRKKVKVNPFTFCLIFAR